MKKQDVYEIIVKVFGLYCIWNLMSLINILFSFSFGHSFELSILNLIIYAILAYVCLYKTDKLMKVLNLIEK
jgi:hypothetical protein